MSSKYSDTKSGIWCHQYYYCISEGYAHKLFTLQTVEMDNKETN